MNLSDAAKIFNGKAYRNEDPDSKTLALLKEAGIVAVYGASDDIMVLNGAVDDEASPSGATFFKNGMLECKCDDTDCPYEVKLEKMGATVSLEWDPKELDASWLAKTDLPHETFDIFEDGELYCRGLVFRLSHCPVHPLGDA